MGALAYLSLNHHSDDFKTSEMYSPTFVIHRLKELSAYYQPATDGTPGDGLHDDPDPICMMEWIADVSSIMIVFWPEWEHVLSVLKKRALMNTAVWDAWATYGKTTDPCMLKTPRAIAQFLFLWKAHYKINLE